ncbi:protein of unknown function DUF214 [Paenibacillus curdlanolyticus YK9]|uniref:ABC3 transporter permease C-terminal domain-containing protein n=1 Tax=Paenibacillus curdlanolyticus YK9 TaxID=717606 RepID=E0I916_9BACL|nr:FtsX-like permease family protein [Paenibacillus curdlanolyticus]EFM10900.1 protein of unknown function DUF214 [Paenibacillus curdlanolyticus YK9]
MLRSSLVWKMSILYLRRQWKQTLIAILGGSIGAILIGLSFSFYYSLVQSGDQYIEAHYGSIDWELLPDGVHGDLFSNQQIAEMEKPLHNMPYNLLPIVRSDVEAKLVDGSNPSLIPHLQLIGMDTDRAAVLEPQQSLWATPLKEDDLIMDQATAEHYDITNEQIIQLTDKGGAPQLFRVHIAKEQGLTGYRQGTNEGTVIIRLDKARQLNGITADQFTSVLVGGLQSNSTNGVYPIPQAKLNYLVESTKNDASNKIQDLRSSYGIIFILLASVAIIAGLLLLVQLLIMQSKSRSENYGILRALGLSRNQTRGIFLTESMILTLLQASVGTVLGVSGGLGLIKLYYSQYGEMLQRVSGYAVPIKPYFSWVSTLEAFGTIMFFQLAVTLIAAWIVGKQGILKLLGRTAATAPRRKWRKGISGTVVIAAIIILALHLYYANTETGVNLLQSPLFIWVDLIWLLACFSLVHLAIRSITYWMSAVGVVMKRFGWSDAAFFMASRYPKQELKQTYIVSLLFSLIVLVITSTIIITTSQSQYNDVNKTNQSIMGYGGQIPYKTDKEKQRFLHAIERDPDLISSISSVLNLETYQLVMGERPTLPNTVVPVTEQLVNEGELPLVARAKAYANDREAWEAVSRDNSVVILDERFMVDSTVTLNRIDKRAYQVGQTVTFPVYEHKIRGDSESLKPVTKKTLTVIGFAKGNVESKLSNQLYNATFVSPGVFDGLRPYGYMNTEYKYEGYLLLNFDYQNLEKAQAVEEGLLNQGIKNSAIPYLQNGAKNFMNQQIIHVFIGFMSFTALIAICGLAIIQIRAVQIRAKQIAMLRCIGLSNKLLIQMFLLEGFFISAIGTLIGTILGSTGGYMYLRIIRLSAISAHLQEVPYKYPIGAVITIVVGVSILSAVINWFPSRRVLAIKPGEAMREST